MRSLLLITLLLMVWGTHAQTYSVLHVIGKIAVQETGEYLQQGSKIELKQNLKFETAGARAAVLSTDKGRYVIQAPESTVNQTNQIVTALISVLKPASGRMSTRAGGINNLLDLSKQLGEGTVAWINEELAYATSLDSFPVDDKRFFFVRYQYENEPINKKLRSSNDSLVFNRTELFQVDNQAIDPDRTFDHQLFYYDKIKESSRLVTPINWIVISKAELNTLIDSLEDLPEEERTLALEQLVSFLYGKCSAEDIRLALESR